MDNLGRTSIFTCRSDDRKSVGSVFPGIGEEKGVADDKGDSAAAKRFPTPSIVLGAEHEKGVNVSQVDKGAGEVRMYRF